LTKSRSSEIAAKSARARSTCRNVNERSSGSARYARRWLLNR
jgi:hypothetical protein